MSPGKWDRDLLRQHLAFAISLLLASGGLYATDRWLLHGSWVESAIGIAIMDITAIFVYTSPIFI